jgi:hypothetical protein
MEVGDAEGDKEIVGNVVIVGEVVGYKVHVMPSGHVVKFVELAAQ